MTTRKPIGFDAKLNASIELLKKAEPLALRYSEGGYYLAFSGGKDSQALYHVAQMAGVKFEAFMSATSVDPPQVIRFVKRNYPNITILPPPVSMYDRAVERGILPSMRVRWCCVDFKEGASAGRVTLTGVRRAESARRAKRNEMEVSGHKFSGSTEQFEQWQAEQVEKIKKRMLRKEGKHLNEDYFSVDKDREIRCIGGKDTIIVNPLLQWTEADVWYFLNEVVKVPHCELYDRGYKRIGCILCPMSSHKQKLREMKDYPHVKRGWIRAIKKIREGGGIARRTYTPAKCGITPPTAAGIGSGRSSQESGLDSAPRQPPLDGFSDSPSQDCACGGQNLTEEDLIAERIFDWWISQKSYSKWYADNYIQQYLNFDEDNGNMETNT